MLECLKQDHMKETAKKKAKNSPSEWTWLAERWGLSPALWRNRQWNARPYRCEYKGVWNSCQAVIHICSNKAVASIVIASSVTGDIVADAEGLRYDKPSSLVWQMLGKWIPRQTSRTALTRICAYTNGWKDGYWIQLEQLKKVPSRHHSRRANETLGRPLEVSELFAFLGSDEANLTKPNRHRWHLTETMSMLRTN